MFALRDDQVAVYSPAFLARLEAKRAEQRRQAAELALQRAEELRKAKLVDLAEEAKRQRQADIAQKAAFKAGFNAAIRAEAALARAKAQREEMEAKGYKRRVRVADIERRACRVFKVTSEALRGQRRSRHIVLARQFVMYWAARQTALSLPQIGRLMGGRDHTTILHGKNVYVEKRAFMGRILRPAR